MNLSKLNHKQRVGVTMSVDEYCKRYLSSSQNYQQELINEKKH